MFCIAHKIVIVGLVGVLSAACSSGTQEKSQPENDNKAVSVGACLKDSDCTATGFCDNRVCTQPAKEPGPNSGWPLGRECTPPPAGQPVNQRYGGCSEYVCIEMRCRSCTTDKDCENNGRMAPQYCLSDARFPGKVCTEKAPTPGLTAPVPPVSLQMDAGR